MKEAQLNLLTEKVMVLTQKDTMDVVKSSIVELTDPVVIPSEQICVAVQVSSTQLRATVLQPPDIS